jgi:hypothetical protein
MTVTLQQAMASLHYPGWLEIGEPDISATIAEYGSDFYQWPCDEWDWTRHLILRQVDGTMVDLGPDHGWASVYEPWLYGKFENR